MPAALQVLLGSGQHSPRGRKDRIVARHLKQHTIIKSVMELRP